MSDKSRRKIKDMVLGIYAVLIPVTLVVMILSLVF